MESIIALAFATIILVAIPGPNVALIVANTLRYNFKFGAITVIGTTIGIAIQLTFVIAGLAAILTTAASAMVWIKWIGVIYLIYLGVKTWREDTPQLSNVVASESSAKTLFFQGLGFSIINPKTLIFNAAFLPQFLETGTNDGNLLALAIVYISILFVGDLIWAAFANILKPIIDRFSTLRNKLTGSIFMVSGVGLAFSRIER